MTETLAEATAQAASMHPVRTLLCEIPERIHPVCSAFLDKFIEGGTSVHTPAYACNMVDSRLLPLVECLLDTYADGVLLAPFVFQ